MNPDFIYWYNNISTIDLIITIVLCIIVFVPILLFLGMLFIALFFHEDSNDINNNDTNGCL